MPLRHDRRRRVLTDDLLAAETSATAAGPRPSDAVAESYASAARREQQPHIVEPGAAELAGASARFLERCHDHRGAGAGLYLAVAVGAGAWRRRRSQSRPSRTKQRGPLVLDDAAGRRRRARLPYLPLAQPPHRRLPRPLSRMAIAGAGDAAVERERNRAARSASGGTAAPAFGRSFDQP